MKVHHLLIFVGLLSAGLGCAVSRVHLGPPLTDRQKDYYLSRYWADAQELLEDKTNGASIVVPYDIFQWHWSKSLLVFDDELVYGYYARNGSHIWVVEFRPWTIRHEACHAILDHLKFKDWIEYCHEGKEWQ